MKHAAHQRQRLQRKAIRTARTSPSTDEGLQRVIHQEVVHADFDAQRQLGIKRLQPHRPDSKS